MNPNYIYDEMVFMGNYTAILGGIIGGIEKKNIVSAVLYGLLSVLSIGLPIILFGIPLMKLLKSLFVLLF